MFKIVLFFCSLLFIFPAFSFENENVFNEEPLLLEEMLIIREERAEFFVRDTESVLSGELEIFLKSKKIVFLKKEDACFHKPLLINTISINGYGNIEIDSYNIVKKNSCFGFRILIDPTNLLVSYYLLSENRKPYKRYSGEIIMVN